MAVDVNTILALEVEERIRIMEAIMASLDESQRPLRVSAEDKRELNSRYQEYLQDPHEGASLNEVRGRIDRSL